MFDEADLLLSGGYGAQMRIIWDALRAGDRLHAARRVCLQARLAPARRAVPAEPVFEPLHAGAALAAGTAQPCHAPAALAPACIGG